MKKGFLFSIIALTTVFAYAQEPSALVQGTPLSGSVHGFIKVDQSPYTITEDITVEPNQVLVIEPGVKLQFAPGTGLYVKGQFVAAGLGDDEVVFVSAANNPQNGDWKGIFITGSEPSEIRGSVIVGAENGIVVENSAANILSSKIKETSNRGVYAKNSKVAISGTQFTRNNGAAVHIDSYSDANITDVYFHENNVALYNAPLAITEVTSANFEKNSYAVLNMANNHLAFTNSQVKNNKVGASSADVLDKGVIESIGGNETEFNKDYNGIVQTLPASPEIPGVESRPVNDKDKIADLFAQKQANEDKADSTQKPWNLIGSVSLDNHYHHIKTRKVHGERSSNNFQVPGFGTDASIYLLMQSNDGKSIEFNGDISANTWNYFSPNPITLTYTDSYNKVELGDFTKVGGELYMTSLPVFGIGYTLSLLKNNANLPVVELNGFFGENRKPYLIGDRHPDIYKNYIEDGEAQAQRLTYGGSVKWAPFRRFDISLGAIYADDEIDDPLLRDGGSRTTITSEPLQQSLTLYADGNWLFYPGDIELNGQIAVGRADTADVFRERAINKVFSLAGISTTSMAKLRQLMINENKINSLSAEELEEIFGGNTTLNRSQMRDSLRTLVRAAKQQKKEYDNARDDDRVMGLNWNSQNFAFSASLFWNIYKTSISTHIKYIGEDFYSAGSPDQLSDTREFGASVKQIIKDFWTLNFGYALNVENAAKDGKNNLFGLGEGTQWGLYANSNSEWFDKHELDYDRTKYIQNWTLSNDFKIGKKIDVSVGYNLEYRTQYRPNQLHGNYLLEDGIYKDRWFAARTGNTTTTIVDEGISTVVDSARWAQYTELADADYLASKFQERIYKNIWNLDVSVKAFNTTFRAGGRWTLRTDNSKFYKDNLIKGMDFSNTTWAKLGYYFGGADYFEQTYPLSATTTLNNIQNHFGFTPRLKSYERNDMTEREFTIDDEFEIPFRNRFLILGISAEFRYLNTDWEENGKSEDETEMDVLGNINLRVNHTKRLSSEWYTGAAYYHRPDNLSDEYKDIYGGVRVNYLF